MKNRNRRVRKIELSLTPLQVVVVWLKDAVQTGTAVEGARHWPPYRATVANAVLRTVRNSMKGQSEQLIERAVLQARQEADLLYNLIINANMEVIENRERRGSEYLLLLGYLSAVNITEYSLATPRMAILMFIDAVSVLDAAITQVAAERINGQPMLFRDCKVKLEEQVQMAESLVEAFNVWALAAGTAEINLEKVRNSLQWETDHRISSWIDVARVAAITTFGTEEQMHAEVTGGALSILKHRTPAFPQIFVQGHKYKRRRAQSV
jgi:hypothetical protein